MYFISGRINAKVKPFLDTFSKFRKATISFVVSVRIEQLGSPWVDIHEI